MIFLELRFDVNPRIVVDDIQLFDVQKFCDVNLTTFMQIK